MQASLSDASYPRLMVSLRLEGLASKSGDIAPRSERFGVEVTYQRYQCDHIVSGWRWFRQQSGARDFVDGVLSDVL